MNSLLINLSSWAKIIIEPASIKISKTVRPAKEIEAGKNDANSSTLNL